MRIPFIKMHGLGNDFVVLDGRDAALPVMTPAIARALADRRTGIGCDQLIVLEPGITHTTGLPAYNAWTSAIGCPAVTVPMLAVGGMPVGVQIVGRHDDDWRTTGVARWLKETVAPVAG
jgi:diaminopimelate epimerase